MQNNRWDKLDPLSIFIYVICFKNSSVIAEKVYFQNSVQREIAMGIKKTDSTSKGVSAMGWTCARGMRMRLHNI